MSVLMELATLASGVDVALNGLHLPGTPGFTRTVSPGADLRTQVISDLALAGVGISPASFYRLNLNPGVYETDSEIETGNGDWVHMRGLGTAPAQTVIQSDNQNLGTLYTHSGIYLDNLTVRAYTSNNLNGPRYPWHISYGSMVVATNCVFDIIDAAAPTSGGNVGTSGRTGADGDNGMFIVFYKCTFKSNKAKQPDPDNMHGPVPWNVQAEPMTLAYIDCTFEGNGDIMFESTGSTGGTYDRLFVIGCTGVTSISGVNNSYPAANNATMVYTDAPVSVPVNNAVGVVRNNKHWPIPVNGLSAFWSDD